MPCPLVYGLIHFQFLFYCTKHYNRITTAYLVLLEYQPLQKKKKKSASKPSCIILTYFTQNARCIFSKDVICMLEFKLCILHKKFFSKINCSVMIILLIKDPASFLSAFPLSHVISQTERKRNWTLIRPRTLLWVRPVGYGPMRGDDEPEFHWRLVY